MGEGGDASNASFRVHRKWGQKRKQVTNVEIGVTTLDRLTADADLVAPFALWIDVEGFAMDVLRGAEVLLETGSVCAILAEVEAEEVWAGQGTFADVRSLLATSGFVPVGRDHQFRSRNVFNVLFLPLRVTC